MINVMSPKKKLLIYYGIWVAMGLGFLALAINVNSIFFIPLIGLMFVFGSSVMIIKCPNCGNKIMIRRQGLSKIPLVVRGWPPKACPDCGKPIS